VVLYAEINEELEKKFRLKAVEKFGGKGAVAKAIEEAIKLWLKS
jgi:hypothetical protein